MFLGISPSPADQCSPGFSVTLAHQSAPVMVPCQVMGPRMKILQPGCLALQPAMLHGDNAPCHCHGDMAG